MIQVNRVGTLINYSRSLDKYTRFIYYTYYSRTEYISDDKFRLVDSYKVSALDTSATHLIALVNWGIDVVVVLQLPHDDELIVGIDNAIKNLCNYLRKDDTRSELSQKDINYLEKIVHTQVCSNISFLSQSNSIVDFYRDISRIKNNSTRHEPCNYNLCPIYYFYAINNKKQGIFNELELEHQNALKHYLLQLSFDFKRSEKVMDQDYPNLQQHLKDQLYEMRARWSNLKEMYKSEVERLQNLVISIRRGEIDQTEAQHQTLHSSETKSMTKMMNEFTNHTNIMREKECLLKDLSEKRFKYQNATDRGVNNDDDEQAIEQKLLVDRKRERIICSDDSLYKTKQSQWYTLYVELLKEREENPQLQFIYVDFTNSEYRLKNFMIFPAIRKSNIADALKSATTSLLEREKSDQVTLAKNSNGDVSNLLTTLSSQRSTSDDIINILLLGESGVGKSTFINAFVNYLKYNTLEQAQKNAIVLIPVSFIMTTGDNFEEHTVKFGGMDTLSNEVHDNPGQSVTQHCKSYMFTLGNNFNSKQKLRIIDTPGIGDMRGVAQDDLNMQHILSYINNLTHLSAICILMKPNNDRLNIFFRSCFMQLFDLLGENARDKIIFCFTNARSTFYTPGNTAPLLKKLLESLPVERIPFTKHNTFCFDSESFRYLVAVQNKIRFNEDEREEYKDSWNKSSGEAKRFLNYILKEITPSLIVGDSKSVKHTQLTVSLLIRPILETMRNVLRNIVLWNAGSRTVSIALCPRTIKGTTAICLKCSRDTLQLGNFWITADELHVFHNKCRTCSCSPTDHYPIDYQLEYKLCDYPASNSYDEIADMLVDLCKASAEFAHFLFGTEDTSQNDRFISGFERMIKEESDICAAKKPCQLNTTLLDQLKQLKINYEDMKKKLATKREHFQLSDIHKKIEDVNKYPIIQLQMTAVKEWQKFMLRYYEYEVPN
jgi:GTPase SAR1 family protein